MWAMKRMHIEWDATPIIVLVYVLVQGYPP